MAGAVTKSLLLLAWASVAMCQLPGDFWDFDTEETMEGDDVELNCNFTFQDPEDDLIPFNATFQPRSWMLPNLTIIDNNSTLPGFDVSEDSYYLTIRTIDRERTGTYHCMLWVNEIGEWRLVRKGLNVRGPYFISSKENWDETYKTPFIIGISSCLGFLAASILIYMVYMFRWIPDEDDEGYDSYQKGAQDQTNKIEVINTFDNFGFKPEEKQVPGAPGFVPTRDSSRYRLAPPASSGNTNEHVMSTEL